MLRENQALSVTRLTRATRVPRSTVGRWVRTTAGPLEIPHNRRRPRSGDPALIGKIRQLCQEDRHRTYGHRRIWAPLRQRYGLAVNRKTVARIMREEGLADRPRPKRLASPQKPPNSVLLSGDHYDVTARRHQEEICKVSFMPTVKAS